LLAFDEMSEFLLPPKRPFNQRFHSGQESTACLTPICKTLFNMPGSPSLITQINEPTSAVGR
jgi:hypothetical protein